MIFDGKKIITNETELKLNFSTVEKSPSKK